MPKNPHDPGELLPGRKIESRLDDIFETALSNYMRDSHRENRAEVNKSAIAFFLEYHGYLRRTKNGYELTRPRPRKPPSFQFFQIATVIACASGLTVASWYYLFCAAVT